MSKTFVEKIKCPRCGKEQEQTIYASINVELNPELKDMLLRDEINIFKCNSCNNNALMGSELLYHDPIKEFAVWFKPNGWTDKDTADYKRFKKIIGEDNYFVKPLVINDFKLMVISCDGGQIPKTDEEKNKLLELIHSIINKDKK
jgi:hypothetical protein